MRRFSELFAYFADWRRFRYDRVLLHGVFIEQGGNQYRGGTATSPPRILSKAAANNRAMMIVSPEAGGGYAQAAAARLSATRLQTVEHRGPQGESEGEKQRNESTHNERQDEDSYPTIRAPSPDIHLHDAAHNGHQYDGKKGADINQQQEVAHIPGRRQPKGKGEGEDNFAVEQAWVWAR